MLIIIIKKGVCVMRKGLSLFLAVVLLVGLIPRVAVATTSTQADVSLPVDFEITRSPISAGFTVLGIQDDSILSSTLPFGGVRRAGQIEISGAIEVGSDGGEMGFDGHHVLRHNNELRNFSTYYGRLDNTWAPREDVFAFSLGIIVDLDGNTHWGDRDGNTWQMDQVADVVAGWSDNGLRFFALRTDGSVWSAYDDGSYEKILTGIVQIDARHSILIARDIYNRMWRYSAWDSSLSIIATDVTDMSIGLFGTLAKKVDGTLWLYNRSGSATSQQLDIDASDIVYITSARGSMGNHDFAVFLREDGSVWTIYQEWIVGQGRSDDFTFEKIMENINMPITRPGGTVTEQPPQPPTEEELPFADVTSDNWFYPYVRFVHDNGIMQGTTSTTFAPNQNFSRAMVVATLYRAVHGDTAREIPYEDNRTIFSDVSENAWYSPYSAWAYDNGIVTGVGGNRFAPNQDVTREQFATMLYRFAELMEYDVEIHQGKQWNDFTDISQISEWADDALTWANYHALITGRTATSIVPSGTAIRAEASAILTRFMQAFGT